LTDGGLDTRSSREKHFAALFGCVLAALFSPVFIGAMSAAATAQQRGGILQIAHRDSPASMSPLEEVTISTIAPMMAVFNNLVLFDQHVPQNSPASIVPDLAERWSWSAEVKTLHSGCATACVGMTDSRLRLRMSNAHGTCCSATPPPSSASIRAKAGIGTLNGSRLPAITR
jgi:hypothetical protein